MKSILEQAALILGLINGLLLLFLTIRNRPILKVSTFSEDTNYCFHATKEYMGEAKDLYGYLTYVSVINKGNKEIAISNWELKIPTEKDEIVLSPIAIPDAKIQNGNITRTIRALGVNENSLVKSGDGVSGYACYLSTQQPKIENNSVRGEIIITPVYGRKVKCKLVLLPKHHEFFSKIIPEFESLMDHNFEVLYGVS